MFMLVLLLLLILLVLVLIIKHSGFKVYSKILIGLLNLVYLFSLNHLKVQRTSSVLRKSEAEVLESDRIFQFSIVVIDDLLLKDKNLMLHA